VPIRIRFTELLRRRRLTAYAVATASGGRISLRMAYRLKRQWGRFSTIRADVLEALCDVFGVGLGDLLERTGSSRLPRQRSRT
jgi:DNA-binding Xre family transcriptional regulator